MRLVIDLQGAQTESRFRGIGRYSLSLAKAMTEQARGHEVWLVLNECFPETIEPIRASFEGLIPQERIRVFSIPAPVREIDEGNSWRARSAEIIREAYINNLYPDVIHISSLFEGWIDDASVSVKRVPSAVPTVVTHYDLIPFLRKDVYLSDARFRDYYYKKLASLKRTDLLLAISESSRKEVINAMNFSNEQVVNISAAVSPEFVRREFADEEKARFLAKYGLSSDYVLYAGGFDERKNVDALMRAYSNLPHVLRECFSLVLTGKIPGTEKIHLQIHARALGIVKSVRFLGHVSDEDLISLYSLCHLFVLPSLHEGFGLPILEAMACGAAVIGANRTSIPEVIGREDALFNPEDPEAISKKMQEVLENENFHDTLQRHAREQSQIFSWDRSAQKTWDAIEQVLKKTKQNEFQIVVNSRPRMAYVSPLPPDKTGIADYGAELLPELSKYYDIEVIVAQERITDPWVLANCPIRSVSWFKKNAGRFDRILYNIGNSPYHAYMFDLLHEHPGIVVLNDVLNFIKDNNHTWDINDIFCNYCNIILSKQTKSDFYKINNTNINIVLDKMVGAILLEQNLVDYNYNVSNDIMVVPKNSLGGSSLCFYSIENLYLKYESSFSKLIKRIVDNFSFVTQYDNDIIKISNSICTNQSVNRKKQIFVDVSEIVRKDLKTGIQRVVRSILLDWLKDPPVGYVVQPIYADDEGGYRYAGEFACRILETQSANKMNSIVEYFPGDIFVGLDLCGRYVINNENILRSWRLNGVKIYFVIYDILPISLPDVFPLGSKEAHTQWLESVVRVSDSLFCISNAVASEVKDWISKNAIDRNKNLSVDWFHLGADIEKSAPTSGLPDNYKDVLCKIQSKMSFLMVGTIEPRKAHEQAIAAFEYLWRRGIDANLVIVGKEGWTNIPEQYRRSIPKIVQTLRNHEESGIRLFWFEGISDEYLEKIYESCSALLAASYNEGFGLPLIEAASRKIPIVARDIPVFREVAGEHAFYFSGFTPENLGEAISQWMVLREKREAPLPEGIQWKTWRECAKYLMNNILK